MIYLGADHNGFQTKEKLKKYLTAKKIEWQDCGAFKYEKSDDYPDFARDVAKKIAKDKGSLGILLCGSGHGMVVAANKVKGAYAMMATSPSSAYNGRHDDYINILALAVWQISFEQMKKVILKFSKTIPGKDKRYVRRFKKVKRLER